jgi:hypothetical protein
MYSKRNVNSMNAKRMTFVISILAAAWLIDDAAAHHSTSNFDSSESATVTLTGVVTYWNFANPHTLIDMNVVDDDGNVVKYKVETTSKVALQRHGWRPDRLKPGDRIVVEASPDFKHPTEVLLRRIVFADGSEWRRDSIPL